MSHDAEFMDPAAWASRYISMYKMALVPIPPGTKGPMHEGWNRPGRYVMDAEEAQRRWSTDETQGIGAVLAPSGLCSLDVDSPEHAEGALRELGIALDALRKSTPTIQGNPSRYRLMFRAPPGVVLGRKALVWPARTPGEKPLTLFELRGGDIQDVLPPTIHPGTRKPYIWLTPPNSEFPPLPATLRELWLNWESYRKELEAMCPWAGQGFRPEPAPRGDGARPNVIGAFNAARVTEGILEAHGYTQRGKRWISPTSSSGLAGVVMLDGRVFSHHSSDSLADGHAHDAFDVYRILNHAGDTRAAIKAAAEDLGIDVEGFITSGDVARAGRSGHEGPQRDGFATGARTQAPQDVQNAYPPVPASLALRIDPNELAVARLTPQCIVPSLFYSDVAVLAAPGSTGKTTLALWEAAHVALGRALYGLQVQTPGSALFVTAEDSRELLIARLRRVMEEMDLSDEDRKTVCSRVFIWDVSGSTCRLAELDKQGNVQLTGLADAIVERFRDEPPVLVTIDPTVSFGAGERLTNDNEQALILASRRIVKGLGCCVRLICHTGKANARDGTLDQYSSRGGSALADGARMVTVLRRWDPGKEEEALVPPIGFTLGRDDSAIVLARPKLSYAPPQPLIWIKRSGYAFEHFLSTRRDPEAEAKARVDQVERYLTDQLARGSRHTKKTLEDSDILPQKKLRIALSELIASGRVVSAPMPEALRHGGRQDYLHPAVVPVASTSASEEQEGNQVGPKSPPTSSSQNSDSTSSLPYRKKTSDEVDVSRPFLSACHFVNDGQRGTNEVDEVGETECPAGVGRLVDDEPEVAT